MDDAIVAHVKRAHGLEIGEGRAEQLKIEIGSAWAPTEEGEAETNGRDLRTGRLRRTLVSGQDARQALDARLMQIVDAVREALELTPPELSADISERGIVLAGGGVLLRGFRERLQAETGLPVHVVQEPLTCVAVGADAASTSSRRSRPRPRPPDGARAQARDNGLTHGRRRSMLGEQAAN
jgi:rod shape-determining protein MreB